jgi:hypothetical protein
MFIMDEAAAAVDDGPEDTDVCMIGYRFVAYGFST